MFKGKHELLYEEIKTNEDLTTLRKSKVSAFKLKNKHLKQIKRTCIQKRPQILLTAISIILFIIIIQLILKLNSKFSNRLKHDPPLVEPAFPPFHYGEYVIIAINYANKRFEKSQQWNTETALENGDVDGVISYSPEYIDKSFYKKNKKILEAYRGAGYFLWKPYFILQALEKRINKDEYLIYSDCGMAFLNSTDYFVSIMKKKNLDIMAFNLEGSQSGKYREKYYTKRDAFVLMKCDSKEYYDSYQFLASAIIFKKTDFSLKFVKEWLKYSQDSRIITDSINTLGYPNYEGFSDHRHVQSIFSLLAKKYGLEKFRDPRQWGGYKIFDEKEEKKGEDFPVMFYYHGRNANNWNEFNDKRLIEYLKKTMFAQSEFLQIEGIENLSNNNEENEEGYNR